MTNLLHIDSSLRGDESVSREMSSAFATAWRAANPDGGYTYRDLYADPVPHLTNDYATASLLSPEQRSDSQRAAWDAGEQLRDELRAADVVVLGVPMYNFTIPSTLKAWLDHVVVPEFTLDDAGDGVLVGKKVVAVTARGGAYGPGTPRADFDFQEPLLRGVLSQVGLDRNLTFVHTEMVLSYVHEKLAQFRHIHDASRENAHKVVQELAAVS